MVMDYPTLRFTAGSLLAAYNDRIRNSGGSPTLKRTCGRSKIDYEIQKNLNREGFEDLARTLSANPYECSPALCLYIDKETEESHRRLPHGSRCRIIEMPMWDDAVVAATCHTTLGRLVELHPAIFCRAKEDGSDEVGVQAVLDLVREARLDGKYTLKVDIVTFFDAILTDVLREDLRKCNLTNDEVSLLINLVTPPRVDADGDVPRTTGISQGNLLSPTMSNLYLNGIAQTLEEMFGHELQQAYYVDDLAFCHEDPDVLAEVLEHLERLLERRGLQLNDQKEIYAHNQDFSLLGEIMEDPSRKQGRRGDDTTPKAPTSHRLPHQREDFASPKVSEPDNHESTNPDGDVNRIEQVHEEHTMKVVPHEGLEMKVDVSIPNRTKAEVIATDAGNGNAERDRQDSETCPTGDRSRSEKERGSLEIAFSGDPHGSFLLNSSHVENAYVLVDDTMVEPTPNAFVATSSIKAGSPFHVDLPGRVDTVVLAFGRSSEGRRSVGLKLAVTSLLRQIEKHAPNELLILAPLDDARLHRALEEVVMTSYRRQVATERYVEGHISWCFRHRKTVRPSVRPNVVDVFVTHSTGSQPPVFSVETPIGVYSSGDSPWILNALCKRPRAALLDTLTKALTDLAPKSRRLRIEHHGALQRDLIIQGTGKVTTVFGPPSTAMRANTPDLAYTAGQLHEACTKFTDVTFVHVDSQGRHRATIVWHPPQNKVKKVA